MQSGVGYWSTYHDMNTQPEAMRLLNAASNLPSLVVFDLDYTLWPYFCECRSKRESPVLYPQAKAIIRALKSKGILMAVASRSPTADTARTFLSKLDLVSSFSVMEIYPSWSHKTDHFQKIHQKTGIPYNQMLFFDDEDRNIRAVTQMGVTSVHVSNGVNTGALETGLQKFAALTYDDPSSTVEVEKEALNVPAIEHCSLSSVVALAESVLCMNKSCSCQSMADRL